MQGITRRIYTTGHLHANTHPVSASLQASHPIGHHAHLRSVSGPSLPINSPSPPRGEHEHKCR